MTQSLLRKAILAAIYGGTALVAAPSIAIAQGAEEAEELETITVIGSRIKRVDLETSQPVFVIEKEDLNRSGLSNVGDVLTQLVYADNSTVTTVTNNTNGGDGSIQVSLRNLGATRTLVLVNGRRWIGDGDGVVDLQTIPLALVERIEVLKDGASAIYGSDAIAGVINIQTRERYDGMEASAFLGENEEGDGRVENYDITMGASTDRASLVAALSYSKQDEILAADREISAVPQFGAAEAFGSDLFFGSSFPLFGRFQVPGNTGPGGAGNITLIPGRRGTSVDDFRAYNSGTDNYNFAPVNFLQQRFDRWSTYVQGRYNLTDNITFFTQAAYIKRRGRQQLAEVPLTLNSTGGSGPQWDFGTESVSTGNVFNPFGRPVTFAGFRMAALGPRQNDFDVDTWAYTGGLEGAFDAFDRNFSWDVGYQYLDTEFDTIGNNYVNLANLRNALGPSFRDAAGILRCGAPGAIIVNCTPFNLFGGPDLGVAAGRVTAAEARQMLDYVGYTLVENQKSQLTNYTANITGDLFELPAGPLSFAAGYEYRSNFYRDVPDALISEGLSSTNFREPTRGTLQVDEYYLEVNVPLLKDMALAESLEFNVAARRSDYSASGTVGLDAFSPDIGSTTNAKFGFTWKPVVDVLVRGNWAETFRAPSVDDLFGGGGEGFPQIVDPCRNALGGNAAGNVFATLTADQQARCRAQGVPAGGYNQPNAQIRQLSSGNRFLAPEFGENRTLGIVYSPSWLEGVDVSLDWYEIELEDALSFFGGNTILSRCIRDGELEFCPFIERVAGGEVAAVRASSFNAAEFIIEGYDVGLSYRFDTDYGKFRVKLDTTYTSEAIFRAEGTSDNDSDVGELIGDGATYRIRSLAGVNWNFGDWDATWNVRYYSPVEEAGCEGFEGIGGCGDGGINRIGSYTYHDVQAGWSAPWDGRVSVGVRNLGDKDPPITFNTFANSFPQGYDIPGRYWYMSYSQRF